MKRGSKPAVADARLTVFKDAESQRDDPLQLVLQAHHGAVHHGGVLQHALEDADVYHQSQHLKILLSKTISSNQVH